MILNLKYLIFLNILCLLLFSCGIIEKTSTHGFNSGFYKIKKKKEKAKDVYLDVTQDKFDIYPVIGKQPEKNILRTVHLTQIDSSLNFPLIFHKNSLDIDITSILLKYRFGIGNLPGQLTTDLNFGVYAGWRHDIYTIKKNADPLGNYSPKISNWGYDFGFFIGPGTTLINPFSTHNLVMNEYNGLILQSGFAGFIESNVASFGISIGLDYLLNKDRNLWIYTDKPWVGFIVGIALN